MFERFTEQARQVVVNAQDEARALRHNYIGTEHLLLGLLRVEEGLAARVLKALDVTLEEVRAQVARIVGEGDEATTGQIPLTPRAIKVLQLALREALAIGHNYIGTEHLLLGLFAEGDGVAVRILADYGVVPENARAELLRQLSNPNPQRSGRKLARQIATLPELLSGLQAAKERVIEQGRFEEAARLKEQQRKLDALLREIQADLQRLDPEPASATGAAASKWQYQVVALQSEPGTWAEQLTALRQEGWELLTVVPTSSAPQAILERRV